MLFLFGTPLLYAQTRTVSKKNEVWIQYYGKAQISPKCYLSLDAGYRWVNFFESRSQYLVRPAIGININPNLRIATGIARLGSYVDGELDGVELRPHQELILRQVFSKLEVFHRYRLEEQFSNSVQNGEISQPGSFNLRMRYGLTARIPIAQLSKKVPSRKFFLLLGNELFMNAGQFITYNFFDQNRILISPALKVNDNWTFSIVWNQQFSSGDGPESYDSTRIIWLQLRHKLDLRKGKSTQG